ncbi:MAG TPA: hypothetical protein VGJ44_16300 [Kribbellaceae bacterium]
MSVVPFGPGAVVVVPSRPLETTANGAGTVASRWKVALSSGWSFDRYQTVEECGSSATTTEPSLSRCQAAPDGTPW